MAKADCYKLAKYSAKLFHMIEEGENLDGWVAAKITKASDYISSVYHYLEYEKMNKEMANNIKTMVNLLGQLNNTLQSPLIVIPNDKKFG
jgi:hypothetical protein